MGKKFELTANTRKKYGRTLYQIRAKMAFKDVKEGELGGWLEEEDSLSQEGDAWVYPDAEVFKGGVIHGGVIRGGDIWGGEIWGGTITGGTIWDGVINGGTIWGGVINGGTIWGGVINGGTIWGGVINGGEIYGGTINGGEINGGTINGGKIYGGIINGGEIHGGVIHGGVIDSTADIISFYSVGSEYGVLTVYKLEDGTIEVTRGCFRGSLAEFKKAVKEKHGRRKVAKEYALAIKMIELRFGKAAHRR